MGGDETQKIILTNRMAAPVFHEIQRFNRWWHYLLIAVPALLVAGSAVGAYLGAFAMTNSKPVAVSGFAILMAILMVIWVLRLKLETIIDEQGIRAHFHGIPFCRRTISWSEIASIDVLTYSPFFDYGGWGVRYGSGQKGWCYNVAGNTGIKITYKNGKQFLIGTQLEAEAKTVIHHFHTSS